MGTMNDTNNYIKIQLSKQQTAYVNKYINSKMYQLVAIKDGISRN